MRVLSEAAQPVSSNTVKDDVVGLVVQTAALLCLCIADLAKHVAQQHSRLESPNLRHAQAKLLLQCFEAQSAFLGHSGSNKVRYVH